MLSIGAMVAGQAKYYTTLAREDYYLEGGEPPGKWHGRGAEALGLNGTVEGTQLANLYKGMAPDGSRSLVQLQRGRMHQPGWDLTFSAPKSVSVLWSQADAEARRTLQAAHDNACRLALEYLQENAAFTRRGRGGAEQEPCGLIAASFEHGTSRAQDPQLHSHVLVLNVGVRDDGTFGTIWSHDLYIHKMVAGVLYRVQLAHECKKLGLELKRGETSFELAVVPEALCDFFSTRSHDIKEAMAKEGSSGPAAAALATLATREVKGHVARDELFRRWAEPGELHGFSADEARSAFGRGTSLEFGLSGARVSLRTGKAIEELSSRQSHFSEAQLLRRVAHALEHRGLPAAMLIEGVRDFLHNSDKLEVVRDAGRHPRFATRDLLKAERRLQEAADRSRTHDSHVVSQKTLAAVCSKRTLTPEQEAALREITAGSGSIKCVEGMAGTGKTYLLSAAREAWEKEGYRVVGGCLSARAARQLDPNQA